MYKVLLLLIFTISISAKDLVLSTSYPVKIIVDEVVGNLFESESILSAGIPTKQYKQNSDVIYKVNKSKVLIYSSEINENWVYDLPKKNKINLTFLIPEEDRIFLNEEDSEDYFWTDPKSTSVVVEKLADTLSVLFPTKAADIQKNAQKFIEKLELIDALIEKKLSIIDRPPMLQDVSTLIYFASNYEFPIPFSIEELPEEDIEHEIMTLKDTGVNQIIINSYNAKDEKIKDLIVDYELVSVEVNVYGYKDKNYYDMMQEISNVIVKLYQ